MENLFQAWNEFKKGKRKRKDVQVFERHLEDNLFSLHLDLKNLTFKHGSYFAFYVHDPKKRHIHKSSVRDRIVHHLLYKFLYQLFDPNFIYDSYSCRENKGTHNGVVRLKKFSRIVSKNYIKECWALKCDIKKFFASIDHQILLDLLKRKIVDLDVLWLLTKVIDSFCSCHSGLDPESIEVDSRFRGNDKGHKGIPLGNLTSQVFANIYMNELDQFVKHKLKAKYYLRYADDFLILSANKKALEDFIDPIKEFLKDQLKLELHPKKVIFRKLNCGIDFLGYIVLPHYILPRTKTKKRMFKKLIAKRHSANFNQSLQSYLGYLSHANSFKLTREILKSFC